MRYPWLFLIGEVRSAEFADKKKHLAGAAHVSRPVRLGLCRSEVAACAEHRIDGNLKKEKRRVPHSLKTAKCSALSGVAHAAAEFWCGIMRPRLK
jgi:hypothetical protein